MMASSITCDVPVFQSLVREGNWLRALHAYGGDFLHGLEVAADERFELWREGVNGQLHQLYSRCIEALVDSSRLDAPTTVEEWTRTALVLRPYDGHLAELHFRAIAEQGRLTEAEIGALEYLRLHATDIGPSAAERLRSLCASIRSTVAIPRTSTTPHRVHFVGRAVEFQGLRNNWVRSAESGPKTLIVQGDPGIGKTRLLEQLARFAAIRGARVISVAASPAIRRVPYTIATDVFRELLGENADAYPTLADLVEGRRSSQFTASTGPQHAVFKEAERLLLACSAKNPLLICVDDLQWVDDTSYEIVQYLANRVGMTVCFAFTVRPEGMSRVAGLRESCECEVQQLEPLNAAGAEELLAAYCTGSGRVLSERDSAMVLGRAAGNPLFLLGLADGLSRADRGAATFLPDSVRTLIADRTRRVSTLAQDVLRILAALRSPEPVEVIARIRGASPLRVARAVEELSQLRLLRDRGGSLEPAHDLVADVVYGEIPASVARLLHKNIRSALFDRGNAFVAYHARCAGDLAEAYQAALAAFKEAQSMRAFAEAEFFVLMAADVAQTTAEREYAASRYVTFMCGQDRPYRAVDVVKQARAHFRSEGDSVGLIRCAAVEVDFAVREGTAPLRYVSSQASELVNQALHIGDKRLVAEVASLLTRMAELGCDDTALATWLELAVEIAGEVEDDWAIPLLGKAAVVAYLVSGDIEADRLSMSLVERAGQDPRHRALASAYRGAVLMLVGRLVEAREQFETTLQLARGRGLEDAHFKASCNYAVIETDMGLYAAARRRLETLHAEYPKNLVNIANAGFLGIESGDLALADWAVSELKAKSVALQAPMTETVAPVIAGLTAWERGDYSVAEQYAALVDPQIGSLSFQSDDSYGRILLGRTRGRTDPELGLDILTRQSKGNRPAVPQLRVDYEAAKLLLNIDKLAAVARLHEISLRATSMQANPLAFRARMVLQGLTVP